MCENKGILPGREEDRRIQHMDSSVPILEYLPDLPITKEMGSQSLPQSEDARGAVTLLWLPTSCLESSNS